MMRLNAAWTSLETDGESDRNLRDTVTIGPGTCRTVRTGSAPRAVVFGTDRHFDGPAAMGRQGGTAFPETGNAQASMQSVA